MRVLVIIADGLLVLRDSAMLMNAMICAGCFALCLCCVVMCRRFMIDWLARDS